MYSQTMLRDYRVKDDGTHAGKFCEIEDSARKLTCDIRGHVV